MRLKKQTIGLAVLLASPSWGAALRAGAARARITPDAPVRMAGFGPRVLPSEGVQDELYARALVVERSPSDRVAILTLDAIGVSRELAEAVAQRLRREQNISRERLLLNASHTHAGPVLREHANVSLELKDDERAAVNRYTDGLVDRLAAVVSAAVHDLAPAEIAFGQGTAGFAVNRRERTDAGFRIGVNPQGPVDHDVPVLRIAAPGGRLRALLFGYACHNVTLGAKNRQFSPDYSGAAQRELEGARPGLVALFLTLCAGDQNPMRSKEQVLTAKHGAALAAAVRTTLAGELASVGGTLDAALATTRIAVQPSPREEFEARKGEDSLQGRHSRAMLRDLSAGRTIRHIDYPVQAIRLGDVLLFALGGEPVIEYALRLKREFGERTTIVAGYSNDVMCYIPTRQMLAEGGYEPVTSMAYYGLPGPLAEDVEDRVLALARRVAAGVGLKPAARSR